MSLRSPPAENALPAPVRTTARTAGLVSHSTAQYSISSTNCSVSVFMAPGRLKVTSATPPSSISSRTCSSDSAKTRGCRTVQTIALPVLRNLKIPGSSDTFTTHARAHTHQLTPNVWVLTSCVPGSNDFTGSPTGAAHRSRWRLRSSWRRRPVVGMMSQTLDSD